MINDSVLEKVDGSRRGFLKKVLKGSAFAAPLIASFSMNGLQASDCEVGPPGNQLPGNSVRAEAIEFCFFKRGLRPGDPGFAECVAYYSLNHH